MRKVINITVNGRSYEKPISSNQTLLDFLRHDLGLTGTKKGCEVGDCGSCIVLLNGRPVNSCLVLAVQAHGKEVVTIEGLATGEGLHPLQEAFIREGAIQCGFCTPGMILSAKHLLDKNPQPSELEIREAISGNLCRCTGYQKIIEAISSVSAQGQVE